MKTQLQSLLPLVQALTQAAWAGFFLLPTFPECVAKQTIVSRKRPEAADFLGQVIPGSAAVVPSEMRAESIEQNEEFRRPAAPRLH